MIWFTSDFHLNHKNIIRFDNRPDKDIESMNRRIIQTTNEYVGENDIFVYMGDFILDKSIDRDDNSAYVQRFAFFLNQLRCKNIIFVSGNHDQTYTRRYGEYRPNWLLWDMFTVWECISCNVIYDPQKRFGLPSFHNKTSCEKLCARPIYNIHPMGYELKITKKLCAEHSIPIEYDGMNIVCTHYSHRVWNKSHHKKNNDLGMSINLYGHSHHGLPGLKNSFDVGFNGWNRPLSLVEILTDLMPKHNSTKPEYIPHHNDERK